VSDHNQRRPVGCASDLELEELLAGDLAGRPDEARLRAHVGGCARCQGRQAALSAEPSLQPDMNRWAPALASSRRALRRRRLFAASGVVIAAAAAAVILVVRTGGLDGSGDRVKGTLALTVHVKRAGGTVDRIAGGGNIRPGEEMRFELSSSAPGRAVVLGLDTVPSVTVYVPAVGGPRATVPVGATGPTVLDGSVVADDAKGFERVFAVVCETETPIETLRARAQAALVSAGGKPEAVSTLGSGCAEASVILRKQDR
jgi:hypothetical protein